MTENKRYIIKGTDDFFLHIEDTTFTEDKHEGAIYNIYQVVRRLNEQDERIRELEKENEQLKAIEKYYVVHYYQENGFSSTQYVIKTFKSKKKADFYAKFMNNEDKDAMYFVYEKKFDDGDIND